MLLNLADLFANKLWWQRVLVTAEETLYESTNIFNFVDEAIKATCRRLELSLAAIAIPLASTSLNEHHKCAS